MLPGFSGPVAAIRIGGITLYEDANKQHVPVLGRANVKSHTFREVDAQHAVAGRFPVVLDALDARVVGGDRSVLFLHVRDARCRASTDGSRLQPDPQDVAGRRRIVSEVLHVAAKPDADFGVDAAPGDLGLCDEARSGQCFRSKQENR